MALAPLSQTLVLTADSSNLTLTELVDIPSGVVTPPAPAFSGNPTISPTSGTTAATYTATDPTVTNGTITLRQWLLGSTVLGTGTTIVPGAGNTGSLTRKVTAVGANGSTITATSTAVTVSAPVTPVSISGTPGAAAVGTAYSFTPVTANGSGTKVFALTGTLPGGLAFSTTTGAISGTPTTAGTTTGLNVTVTDASGSASIGSFSLVVAAAAVTLNALTVSVSNATVGSAFSSTISGLTSGSSVALTGTGAAGLTISGAVINGTPTTAGTINLVETRTGATNSPRTTSGVITVAAAAPTPSNTYANSTQVYANNSSFSPDLVDVEQRLLALGGSYSQYAINYGSGPNTATGDSVSAALVKLQNWIAAIEADRGRAFFTDPFFANGMFARA